MSLFSQYFLNNYLTSLFYVHRNDVTFSDYFYNCIEIDRKQCSLL